MNVLMLNYEFPPIGGGAGNAHFYILKEYSKVPGLKVDVLTSAPRPGFFIEQLSNNITIYKVGVHKKNLHFWRKIEVFEWLFKAKKYYKKLIRKNNYDLIHSFFAFPSAYLCYKDAKKTPFIISLRGSDVPGYNIRLGLDYKLLGRLFKQIWKSASAIIANSNGLRKLALEFIPDLNISVIPNGVDTDIFHHAENKTLHQPVKFLTVCRLIKRKRIDMLIKAAVRAKSEGVELVFDIAGEGTLTESLKTLAQQLNAEGFFNFLGRVEKKEMPNLYHNSDIFIMSSRHEGMSNAMLEAMACGLPIITTKCEGVEELISDNGIVIEQDSIESISNAIKAVCNDAEQYKKMSEHAVKTAKMFSWNKCAEKYLNLYSQISNSN